MVLLLFSHVAPVDAKRTTTKVVLEWSVLACEKVHFHNNDKKNANSLQHNDMAGTFIDHVASLLSHASYKTDWRPPSATTEIAI